LQANHQAALLSIGLISCIYFYELQRIGRLGLLISFVFLIWGIALTQSRTPLLFALLFLGWFLVGKARYRLSASRASGLLMFAAFVLIMMSWSLFERKLGFTDSQGTLGRMTEGSPRFLHWRVLWDSSMQEPWFGWGWLQVTAAQQGSALKFGATHEWITYSHNLFLDLVIWAGLPLGLIVFSVMLYWLLSRLFRCGSPLEWALLSMIGYFFIYSLLEFPHAYFYFLLPIAAMVGILEFLMPSRVEQPGFNQSRDQINFPAVVFLLLMIPFAVLIWRIGVEYFEIENSSREVRLLEAGYKVRDKISLPDVVLLDHQRELIWFRMTPAQSKMSSSDLERMRRVAGRFASPAVLLRYALAAGLNAQADEARRSLGLLCKMWPAKTCQEGREAWAAAQLKYPELGAIASH
jgi:hypothetical protein